MSITPPAQVVGAPRAPLPHGLFSVVALREGSADRWEGGSVIFEHHGCPPASGVIGTIDCDTEEIAGLPKDFSSGGLEIGKADTFSVYGSYRCSPIGNDYGRAEQVARERLELSEERQAESRLWDGAGVTGTETAPQPFTEITAITSTDSYLTAVAELEQALADNYGSLGVIHLSRKSAVLAMDDGAIEVRNGRLQTILGTPVIAGSGYGDGRVVATPALFGYRSQIITSTSVQGDLLDRGKNDLYGLAERTYLIGFDECGPWAVDLPAAETP